jgi:ABC-type transport system involved in multi-copper enzyme maturation permease subunit
VESTYSNNGLSRIFIIAKNAFREAVRDRVLYNLVLFVLLIIASAILLGELTNGQEARTIVNIGLNAMLVIGVFISIFVGVGLVSKEIEKRTVFGIFSKPVHRREFIIGKYLGLCFTLLVNVAVMGFGVSLALIYVGAFNQALTIWGAIFLIFVELAILTAVAIVFSSFSSPALSALLTFFIFIIGHLSASLRDLGQGLRSKSAEYFLEGIYWLMPNLANYSFRTEAANGLLPTAAMLVGGTLYSIAYVTILLIIAVMIFKRRNFK